MAVGTRARRRVSPLTRERARARMLSLSEEEKERRLVAMRQGREAARSPERLAEIEAEIDQLGEEFKSLERGSKRRVEIIRELRELGAKRASFQR